MGWDDPQNRRYMNILRLWNRLVIKDDSRIAKKIFMWDRNNDRNGWCKDVKSIFLNLGFDESYDNCVLVDLKAAKINLRNIECVQWRNSLPTKPKLRTYCKFKCSKGTEDYVIQCKNRYE